MLKKIISSMILGALLAAPLATVAAVTDTAAASAEEVNYTYTEDHSVVDCIHRYKAKYGQYYSYAYCYNIKVPKGELDKVTIYETSESGSKYSAINKTIDDNHFKYLYSDDTSDYYEYRVGYYTGCSKYLWYGIGLKLYYDNGDIHKMATDTANGSTVEGKGYYLNGNFADSEVVTEE